MLRLSVVRKLTRILLLNIFKSSCILVSIHLSVRTTQEHCITSCLFRSDFPCSYYAACFPSGCYSCFRFHNFRLGYLLGISMPLSVSAPYTLYIASPLGLTQIPVPWNLIKIFKKFLIIPHRHRTVIIVHAIYSKIRAAVRSN